MAVPRHFRPENGYVGDAIPIYHQGKYHIFYLKPSVEPYRHWAYGTSFGHAISSDLLAWESLPDAFHPTPNGPDSGGCWSGSVIHKDERFYLFYTGVRSDNPSVWGSASVCVAESRDLIDWVKHPDPLMGPDWGHVRDTHDPFVFWNPIELCYWMCVCSALKDQPSWQGGAVTIARSSNLASWEPGEVIFAPGNIWYPEVPVIFQLGDYWYLTYATPPAMGYDRMWYRVAEGPQGPWKAARTESFGGELFVGGHPVFDGREHHMLAWIPTRTGKADTGTWDWGGDLAYPLRLKQSPDGTLAFGLPDAFEPKQVSQADPKPAAGIWKEHPAGTWQSGEAVFSSLRIDNPTRPFDLMLNITPSSRINAVGVLLFSTADSAGYELALDFREQRIILRRKHGPVIAAQPVELPRDASISLRVMVEDTLVEAFVDSRASLAGRIYQAGDGPILLFGECGQVTFSQICLG